MLELLAIPAWNTPPKTVEDWTEALQSQGAVVTLERESPAAVWLEVGALRFRGYALCEGRKLEAINFELADPDPAPALKLLEAAAATLGWELHADDDEDSDDD